MNSIQLSVMFVSINLLFLTYLLIQSTYFWGGDQLVSNTEGVTYSSYARKGFWELVWVAVISLPLLVFAQWLVRDESPKMRGWINKLSITLIFFIVILELSAAHRMVLYVQSYGLTELRFYSSAFMLFIQNCLETIVFILKTTNLTFHIY